MFKGHCFPSSIILHAVYLKLRFTLSYRDIEELLQMRGVKIDHATIQRWVFKFSPMIEARFRTRKKNVGGRWRMDETYVKIKGQWMYLYRAVDKNGRTIDFILSPRRKKRSAIVEQDHRFIKKRIAPLLGFKSFESARWTLAGIELVRMLQKGQLTNPKSTVYKSFCSLAA